jgi:hypothetical protein
VYLEQRRLHRVLDFSARNLHLHHNLQVLTLASLLPLNHKGTLQQSNLHLISLGKSHLVLQPALPLVNRYLELHRSHYLADRLASRHQQWHPLVLQLIQALLPRPP